MAEDALSGYDEHLWTWRFRAYDDEMLQSWCDRVAQREGGPAAIDQLALAELERRRVAATEKGPT